ncbi:hypothetical protein [Paenibacillus alba]|uniref:Glyoxalase-like domain-containing protein n=1 Tax=Paenibacillus alba TaxID=1197127 RepID=A0ABU6FY66_9BACL|nr:hypothetical protein [Paenibacillus alba]MEC0226822.1 hypothetical protein [Paenibacillus alba]
MNYYLCNCNTLSNGIDISYIKAESLEKAEELYEKLLSKRGITPNSRWTSKGYCVGEVEFLNEEDINKN